MNGPPRARTRAPAATSPSASSPAWSRSPRVIAFAHDGDEHVGLDSEVPVATMRAERSRIVALSAREYSTGRLGVASRNRWRQRRTARRVLADSSPAQRAPKVERNAVDWDSGKIPDHRLFMRRSRRRSQWVGCAKTCMESPRFSATPDIATVDSFCVSNVKDRTQINRHPAVLSCSGVDYSADTRYLPAHT